MRDIWGFPKLKATFFEVLLLLLLVVVLVVVVVVAARPPTPPHPPPGPTLYLKWNINSPRRRPVAVVILMWRLLPGSSSVG